MNGFTFDSNILIDALEGYEPARIELKLAVNAGSGIWISRMVWVEVLSKGSPAQLKTARNFMSRFALDEIDEVIAARAAALRRERSRLRSPDALILASAQVHDRVLVSRKTKDFPIGMQGVRVPYLI